MTSLLDRPQRTADLAWAAENTVDVLVVGLGVTGAGVALDAASRGLSVLAVDAHDVAFGTSRWSSKLVHGGLRYLAKGQLGVAHESAVERGILMTRTAPHLTHAMPMVLPLTPTVPTLNGRLAMTGFLAGDALRRAARTPSSLLPHPRRLSAADTVALVPGVARAGLRGGLVSYDGQLEDDARLVVAIARTAAAHGARIATHTRALSVSGTGATLRDELTGASFEVSARSVVNAAGVWAGQVVPELTLRPSRGTHLVIRPGLLPAGVSVSAPVPGSVNRFVFTLPQADGTAYLGLTDEPVDGPVPDVPTPSPEEVDFLLRTIGSALETPLTRADVVGSFAGLRPLLSAPDADGQGSTADLSRKHAVLRSETGVVTIVGGKLTTYRRMAQDAVDALSEPAGPCRTASLPLVGAASRSFLESLPAPARLVRKYGAEAPHVLGVAGDLTGWSAERLLAPLAEGVPVTMAELVWGVVAEGALTVDDLLDRRTRVGLVPAHRARLEPAAEEALAFAD